MALPAVNRIEQITRHELQRSEYVKGKITEVVHNQQDLTEVQKQALLQGVAEKLHQMLLNRDFAQGIPVRITIGGNQFNIVPPVPLVIKVRDVGLTSATATLSGAFAAACPIPAASSLAVTLSGRCAVKEINAGRNPCGLKKAADKCRESHPRVHDCLKSALS